MLYKQLMVDAYSQLICVLCHCVSLQCFVYVDADKSISNRKTSCCNTLWHEGPESDIVKVTLTRPSELLFNLPNQGKEQCNLSQQVEC